MLSGWLPDFGGNNRGLLVSKNRKDVNSQTVKYALLQGKVSFLDSIDRI
jgi:hypothetical protein